MRSTAKRNHKPNKQMKKIIATIDKKTGKLSVKTEGYSGDECLKATEQLEKGLGMTQGCELTPEYFQQKQEGHQEVGGA